MSVRKPTRRGMRFVATVIVGLLTAPATAKELKARHGIADPALSRLMRRLCFHKVIAPIALQPARRGPAARVYGVSEQALVPLVSINAQGFPSRHHGTKRSVHPSFVVDSFAAAWHALKSECSVADLAEMSGTSRDAMWSLVHHLHDLKVIGVADWDTSSCLWRALYRRGVKRDRPRPQPVPETERQKVYRSNRRLRRMSPRFVESLASNASIFRLAQGAQA